jgi:hypothetical protein
MGGRLDPFTVVVNAGEGVNGLDESTGGDIGDALGFVNDVAQGEAKIAVADGKEIEGMGVTVNGATLDTVNISRGARAQPMDELLFNRVTVGVAADGAASFVTGTVHGFRGLVGGRARKRAPARGGSPRHDGECVSARSLFCDLGGAHFRLDSVEKRFQAREVMGGVEVLSGGKIEVFFLGEFGGRMRRVWRSRDGIFVCGAHFWNLLAAG